MKYTENNFREFTYKKQGKKLVELISKIEVNWHKKQLRVELLEEFQTYLNYKNHEINHDLSTLSKREFIAFAVPIEQEFGKDRKDDEFIILTQDEHPKQRESIPLYLILDNLRSAFNIGSIFRSAECFGVSHIYLCGYTPTPENMKVKKTAMGTEKYVSWSSHASVKEIVAKLKQDKVTIYALETTTQSEDISKIEYKKPCALILGNEALGISEDSLKLADKIVQIPLSGWKNSLNVGVCTAICCYEINKQWK